MAASLTVQPGDDTPLEMFDAAVAELGDRPLLYAWETPIGADAVAVLVDGLATGLAELGVAPGDRVGLYLQNDPQFVVAMLATWRLGAIAVPCNPMLRSRELVSHLRDAGATALVTLGELYASVAAEALEQLDAVRVVVTTEPEALRRPERVAAVPPPGAHDLLALARRAAPDPRRFAPPASDDVAVLTYTSGTTGPSKGAMNTHGNVAAAARMYRDCLPAGPDDVILGIAPLYHVTGLTGHIGLSLAARAPLVLLHRFDPGEALRLAAHHRATVTIAAITAFNALLGSEAAGRHDLSSLRVACSGGAPIPPALLARIATELGLTIRPVYGLTETTGPTHIAPPDRPAPIDPATGVISVGLATPGTVVRILGDDGAEQPAGQVGEVAVAGPQVVPGYWRQPAETAAAIRDGELRTGDVGFVDDGGWLYLVDRRKDMIVASGFKVWPREVEDVLYEHPAVREAAVIGVPDPYRGETVWAYVSAKDDGELDPAALVAHCRERLAAYKCPREVHVLADLPKTATGKILRRALRPPTETAPPR